MSKSRARAVAFLVLLIGFPSSAPAWTDATRLRMIQDALRVTPPAQIQPADLHALMMATAREVGKSYELIGPAFKNDGTPRSRDALDERSIPFGIASLSYSRAVSDIVLVWHSLWASVDGDLSGTPYLDQTPGQEPKPEDDHAEDAPDDRPDRGVSP